MSCKLNNVLEKVRDFVVSLHPFLNYVFRRIFVVFFVLVLILGIFMWFYQDKLVFFPCKENDGKRELSTNRPGERHPSELNMNSEDITLVTDDGVKLHCWFIYHKKNDRYKQNGSSIKARKNVLDGCKMDIGGGDDVFNDDAYVSNVYSKRRAPFYLKQCFPDYYEKYEKVEKVPTIIFFSGNAGNIGGKLPHFWELYNFIGVNIFAVSYRGYGDSDGTPSENGFYLDAKAAYEYVLSRSDIVDRNKVFIYGYSIGGAVAIDLASKYKVSGLILENTFKDMRTVCSRVYPIFNKIPFFLDTFQRLKFESYSKIPNVIAPTLYIIGMLDNLVLPTDSIELYRNSGTDPKLSRIFAVSTGSHNNTWMEAGFEYYKILFKFVYDTRNINDSDYSKIFEFREDGSELAVTGDQELFENELYDINTDVSNSSTLRERRAKSNRLKREPLKAGD
ncbi:hypothetical protein FG386_003494 [Cryptosporidium ryanae]|uniref:uncharacterized protein n=1 Tax=Cryptosporidium ryanae TaxID=515981 RepID=UPI00351A2C41|nr:hypothetical protein FG386_003494 [Cryptosporidium ryanae]